MDASNRRRSTKKFAASCRPPRFGWLDRPQGALSISTYNEQNHQLALQAAREGMVLLKNDGNVLPLDKQKIKTVLMVGPDAYPGEPVGAGSARVVPFAAVSPLQGISSFLGSSVNVFYEAGLPSVVAALSNSAISRLLRRRRRRWRPAAGRRFIPWLSTLTNTGSRAGSEVAQVYVDEAKPSVPRPARELKGFSRVELAAGETKHLTMSLDVRAFAFYDVAGKH